MDIYWNSLQLYQMLSSPSAKSTPAGRPPFQIPFQTGYQNQLCVPYGNQISMKHTLIPCGNLVMSPYYQSWTLQLEWILPKTNHPLSAVIQKTGMVPQRVVTRIVQGLYGPHQFRLFKGSSTDIALAEPVHCWLSCWQTRDSHSSDILRLLKSIWQCQPSYPSVKIKRTRCTRIFSALDCLICCVTGYNVWKWGTYNLTGAI